MEAEVRIVRIVVCGAAEVIRIVPAFCAFDLVEVGFGEGVGGGSGVDGGLVDAAECFVGCDALGDVEGVQREVSGVVEGEEVRVDYALRPGGVYA